MSVTVDSPFKAAATISEGKWLDVWRGQGALPRRFDPGSAPLWSGCEALYESPEEAARHLYRFIAGRGHDPARWLAIAGREHTFGLNRDSVLWRMDTRSLTNARSVRDPAIRPRAVEVVDPIRSSRYVRYETVFDSAQDGIYRIEEPGYAYQRAGAESILEVISIFAPGSDGNAPRAYAEYVAARVNGWRDIAEGEGAAMPTQRKPRVVLAAGHHNTSGGNATEVELTGRLTPLIAAACRRQGMDVRVITPDEGRGMFPGDLAAVAAQVRADDDLLLDVHTEGNGAGDRGRGLFVVYPDRPDRDDVDVDVRDRLGPALARRLAADSGIPLRGNGLMSERQTGVGIDGYRLRMFADTARFKATQTRLLIEYGAHTSPADLARLRTPGVMAALAEGTAAELAAFFGLGGAIPAPVEPEPAGPKLGPTVRDPWGSPHGGDLWVPIPFRDEIERGDWMTAGYLVRPAEVEDGKLVQYTERARLELWPDGRVTRGLLGLEVLALRERVAELEAEAERLRAAAAG